MKADWTTTIVLRGHQNIAAEQPHSEMNLHQHIIERQRAEKYEAETLSRKPSVKVALSTSAKFLANL